MSRLSHTVSTLLIYRHTVLSVLLYLFTMGLFVVLPTDLSWYRGGIVALVAVSSLLHGIIAWRLSVVFRGNADPALYMSATVLGLASLLFIPNGWVGLLIGCLVLCILSLTTISPRIAQFSFPFVHKGWRRLYMVAWICVVYFFLTTLYGAYLFFASFPWFLLVVLAAAGMIAASYFTIRLYTSDTFDQERVMYVVLFFLFTQILSVSLLLPFGLFSFGLLLTWCWYLATLLCRFYVSDRGILWAEQWRYLLIHGLLLLGTVVWFLRWT